MANPTLSAIFYGALHLHFSFFWQPFTVSTAKSSIFLNSKTGEGSGQPHKSSLALPLIQLIDKGDFKLAHKNKYGQDYTPPSTSAYPHP
ncbi:MAG: hypothetical protein WA853_17845 [Candidatus Acidiferrum sp.]